MSELSNTRQYAEGHLRIELPDAKIRVEKTQHATIPDRRTNTIVGISEITAYINDRLYRGVGSSDGQALDDLIASYRGRSEEVETIELKDE